MKKVTKIALIIASFVLVVALSVGGTLAWLTAKTAEVTNTFTVGKINIELKEHNYTPYENGLADDNGYLGTIDASEVTAEGDYDLIPGAKHHKDPFVRVKADSEPCYVYVEVKEVNNVANFIDYTINNDNWKIMTGVTGKNGGQLYYYEYTAGDPAKATNIVTKSTGDQKLLPILEGDTVTVKNVTQDALNGITAGTNDPKLVFYAYAIQASGFDTPALAWAGASSEISAN